MKNKEKFLFWFLLAILVISRIISIVNTYAATHMEDSNLFISSHIAKGVFPSPLLFQANQPHVGGGHFLYSIMAVPFMLIFGKSYFSLRLTSIVFLVLTYLLIYRLCKKYFGFVTTAFASFLFVITPGLLTEFSIVGEGRHFHLNLFFILSLYCLARIKDTKKLLYYLFFGISCGLGVYFYPAFLVTVFVLGIFLLSDIDIKKPSSIYGYLILIICVISAGNFLEFGSPWHNNFYWILFGGWTKNIVIHDDIFSILIRSATLFLKYIPNIFVFSRENLHVLCEERLFRKEYFYNLTTLSRISLEVFRLIFITSCASLCWINRKELKKAIFNIFPVMIRQGIPTKSYIAIFLLAHFFTYIFLFSHNKEHIYTYKYYVPLFLNMILIIAIFLSHIWQRNKALSIILLVSALSPGIIYQYHNFTKVSVKEFYKHYIYFYGKGTANALIEEKPISVQKLKCDRLNINLCHTLGMKYNKNTYTADGSLDKIQKDFEYLSGDDMKKLRYLYQGYVYEKVVGSKDRIKSFSSIIENVDKKYQKFCYIGFGEGIFVSACLDKDKFAFGKYKETVEEYSLFVEEPYRRYFFQGIGEGLAKMFAVPYSRYITDTGLYDYKILEDCLKIIDDKECRKSFLSGFCNKDIWATD